MVDIAIYYLECKYYDQVEKHTTEAGSDQAERKRNFKLILRKYQGC